MSLNILKEFISENAGPISIKFHLQLQGVGWGGVGGWGGEADGRVLGGGDFI